MQGSYKFLSLSTGKKIVRRKFTEIPLPDKVIEKLNRIGLRDKMGNGLSFKDRNGVEYEFDNDDEYKVAQDEMNVIPSPFPDVTAEIPGVLTEHEEIFRVDKVV